jgi:hypothetical protein
MVSGVQLHDSPGAAQLYSIIYEFPSPLFNLFSSQMMTGHNGTCIIPTILA